MDQNRRNFERARVPGVALICTDHVEQTSLIDICLGGIKVFNATWLPQTETCWVELRLLSPAYRPVLGTPIKAKLVHVEFEQGTGVYRLGFQFLQLTEHQKGMIESVLPPY